jgi:hypothetical protein
MAYFDKMSKFGALTVFVSWALPKSVNFGVKLRDLPVDHIDRSLVNYSIYCIYDFHLSGETEWHGL